MVFLKTQWDLTGLLSRPLFLLYISTSSWATWSSCCPLYAPFLFSLLFYPEDRADMFLRSWLSRDYTALNLTGINKLRAGNSSRIYEDGSVWEMIQTSLFECRGRTRWCRGNALDGFESRRGHGLFWHFSWSSSVPPGNYLDTISDRPRPFPSKRFSSRYSSSALLSNAV
jgi:hypothetical protein